MALLCLFIKTIKTYNIMCVKSKKELCADYNISRRTLKKWLKPFFKEMGLTEKEYNSLRTFTAKQVKTITDKLG